MSRITQKGATGPLSLRSGGTFQTSTDASLLTLVGTRWDLSDGREVMLVRAGDAVAAGKLYADAAIIANHQNLAVTAFTAYSANGNTPAQVTVTLGATAVTANQYQGGFVVVNSSTGLGQTLRIASHPAANASANVVVTLEDAPNTALTTSSKVCLIAPHGKDVIISPATTKTSVSAGIGLYAITAASYGFIVTKGIVSALSDTTAPAIGTAITSSVNTAGAIGAVPYATNIITGEVIGNTVQTGVSTEYRTVFVNL